MDKVYYSDPYAKTIKARPQDATIFYPECGGQPGDRGWADDIRILDTKKAEDGSSVYVLEEGKSLDPEKEYLFKLDWDYRYKYMAMHACQHMLSGLLFNMFNIGTVAVHLGEDYLTIEINQESIEKSQIEALVKEANKTISEGHRIIYHEMSHKEAEALGLRRSIKVEGDVRIVEIEGVDRIACGGVHVASTSEIKLAVYTGQEQIRGHVRLFFKCFDSALDYVFENSRIVNELTAKYSCTPAELLPKFEKMALELSEEKSKSLGLSQLIAKNEIKNCIKDGIACFNTDLDVSVVASVASEIPDIALCVFNKNHWAIVLTGKFSSTDFNSIRKDLFPIINAKGGGRTPVFQGIAQDYSEASVEKFKNLFKAMFL